MAGYTVIDVETTGLVPEKHDRIVEIGVVYVAHDGRIQDQWSTLINPQRDVGPTRIHGIRATDVARAPTFADIAPYVIRAMAGRISVAHNSSFDLRFIAHELLRVGVPVHVLPLAGLCTMRWSSVFLNTPTRRLGDCCAASGIALENAHSAGADAFATAQLLTHYLAASRYAPPWVDTVAEARAYAWPTYAGTYPEMRMVHRDDVPPAREDAWLDQIVSRMPRAASPAVDEYLAVLEMALLDGFLAEHEKDQLVSVAEASGLSRGQVLDLHAGYLLAMAEVAWDDGVVTAAEEAELTRIAALLGLNAHDVRAALEEASRQTRESRAAQNCLHVAGIQLRPGDRVVFTGDMNRDRDDWEAIARRHGLEPGGVTKKTAVVVAGDPNSMSGKAAKARAYGLPIIAEAAFEPLLEHAVARGDLSVHR